MTHVVEAQVVRILYDMMVAISAYIDIIIASNTSSPMPSSIRPSESQNSEGLLFAQNIPTKGGVI